MFSLYSALCSVFSLFCFSLFLLLGESGGLLFDFVFCSVGSFDVSLVFLFDWVSLLFYGFISFICGFWVGVLSVFTVFLSGFVSFFEFDLKKLVAMSTLSQLGVMSYGLFVGMWKFAFLHMLVHALFKAVLFLSVGSLMTSVGGSQDFVLFGFEWYFFSYFIFFCSGLCLCGFPFFIGFYSKDFILWGGSFFCLFLWVVFLVGCLFTVFYVFRLYRLVFSKVLNTGCFLVGHFSLFLFFNFLFFWVGFVFFGGFIFWLVLGSVLYWIDGLVLLFGIFLLGFGFLFIFMIYVCFLLFVKLGFLYYVSGSGFSAFIGWINLFLFGDYTWMEEVGAQGIFFHLDFFGKMVGNVLMVITFFGTMGAFFFVLVVFMFV